MSSSKFLHRLSDHCAAVKALAWCPYQNNVLASGGGLSDGCIKIWNTEKGICINNIETKAQVNTTHCYSLNILVPNALPYPTLIPDLK